MTRVEKAASTKRKRKEAEELEGNRLLQEGHSQRQAKLQALQDKVWYKDRRKRPAPRRDPKSNQQAQSQGKRAEDLDDAVESDPQPSQPPRRTQKKRKDRSPPPTTHRNRETEDDMPRSDDPPAPKRSKHTAKAANAAKPNASSSSRQKSDKHADLPPDQPDTSQPILPRDPNDNVPSWRAPSRQRSTSRHTPAPGNDTTSPPHDSGLHANGAGPTLDVQCRTRSPPSSHQPNLFSDNPPGPSRDCPASQPAQLLPKQVITTAHRSRSQPIKYDLSRLTKKGATKVSKAPTSHEAIAERDDEPENNFSDTSSSQKWVAGSVSGEEEIEGQIDWKAERPITNRNNDCQSTDDANGRQSTDEADYYDYDGAQRVDEYDYDGAQRVDEDDYDGARHEDEYDGAQRTDEVYNEDRKDGDGTLGDSVNDTRVDGDRTSEFDEVPEDEPVRPPARKEYCSPPPSLSPPSPKRRLKHKPPPPPSPPPQSPPPPPPSPSPLPPSPSPPPPPKAKTTVLKAKTTVSKSKVTMPKAQTKASTKTKGKNVSPPSPTSSSSPSPEPRSQPITKKPSKHKADTATGSRAAKSHVPPPKKSKKAPPPPSSSSSSPEPLPKVTKGKQRAPPPPPSPSPPPLPSPSSPPPPSPSPPPRITKGKQKARPPMPPPSPPPRASSSKTASSKLSSSKTTTSKPSKPSKPSREERQLEKRRQERPIIPQDERVAPRAEPRPASKTPSAELDLLPPGKSRINLKAQPPRVFAMLNVALDTIVADCYFVNAYPEGSNKFTYFKSLLRRSADECEDQELAHRIKHDSTYVARLKSIPESRLTSTRGNAKKAIFGIVSGCYRLKSGSRNEERIQGWLGSRKYIYPGKTADKINPSLPYRHPAVIQGLSIVYFTGAKGILNRHLDRLAFPIPEFNDTSRKGKGHADATVQTWHECLPSMLALVCCAIEASLLDWQSGNFGETDFVSSRAEATYFSHIQFLQGIEEDKPRAYHVMMGNLFKAASNGKVFAVAEANAEQMGDILDLGGMPEDLADSEESSDDN